MIGACDAHRKSRWCKGGSAHALQPTLIHALERAFSYGVLDCLIMRPSLAAAMAFSNSSTIARRLIAAINSSNAGAKDGKRGRLPHCTRPPRWRPPRT